MNRRKFVTVGAAAGAGAIVLETIGCGKSIEGEISILLDTVMALKALLPGQAAILDKIAVLAKDFNAAYKRGDFSSAKSFFNALADNITQLIGDAGGMSPRIQFLVSLVGITVHAIAALLNEQATPALAKAVPSAVADRITSMSSPAAAQRALAAAKF